MGTIEYKSKGTTTPVEIEKYFPKCVCGGEFTVVNIWTKKWKHWGTSADCNCGEHFFQENYYELKKNIPLGQKARQLK